MTALHDNLRDLGLTRKIMRREASERNHKLRAIWMRDVLSIYTADQLIVLDESSKDGRTLIRKYGRAPSGEDAVLNVTLNRGVRYSILPAMTVDGYIAVRAVEGSIDAAEFFDFVVNDVVCSQLKYLTLLTLSLQFPSMNEYPGPRSVILLDNCTTHKSDALREVVEGSGL